MSNNSTHVPPSYTPQRPGTSSATRPMAPGSSIKKRFASAYVTRFFKKWFIISAALLIALVAALGYNTITRSVDIGQGFTTLGSMLGGVGSMLALMAVVAAAAGLVWLGWYMTQHDYAGQKGLPAFHVGVIVAVVIVVGIYGFHSIKLNQDFWPTLKVVLGFLALSGVTTFMVTRRH